MSKPRYIVVEAKSVRELECKVADKMSDGYAVSGGITISVTTEVQGTANYVYVPVTEYLQAMVMGGELE